MYIYTVYVLMLTDINIVWRLTKCTDIPIYIGSCVFILVLDEQKKKEVFVVKPNKKEVKVSDLHIAFYREG